MEILSAQEVFDTCVGNTIRQGEPAIYEGMCQLRTLTGQKCAAGQLAPDAFFEAFPGSETAPIVVFAARLKAWGRDVLGHVDLIRDLQESHDRAAAAPSRFVRIFGADSSLIARKYGLSTEILDSEAAA